MHQQSVCLNCRHQEFRYFFGVYIYIIFEYKEAFNGMEGYCEIKLLKSVRNIS